MDHLVSRLIKPQVGVVERNSKVRRTAPINKRSATPPDSKDRNLAPISDVTSHYNSIKGCNLIVIRRLTRHTNSANDSTRSVAHEDTTGDRDEHATNSMSDCSKKMRRTLRNLARTDAHGDRGMRLPSRDLDSLGAGPILRQCSAYGATLIQHDNSYRVKIALAGSRTSTIQDRACKIVFHTPPQTFEKRFHDLFNYTILKRSRLSMSTSTPRPAVFRRKLLPSAIARGSLTRSAAR